MENVSITPLSNRVLVQVTDDKSEEQTEGGIIIPNIEQDNETYMGVVRAVGEGRFVNGNREEMQLSEGDEVFFSKHSGKEIPLQDDSGSEYRMVRENNIMGIVE
mgnify:CR=1 FL=1|jgi:chaperonin GroES